MVKHIRKLSAVALLSVVMSSSASANIIKHPTCNIVLTDLNAKQKNENDKLIKELKQIRQFRGSQSRERIIDILEKAKEVNMNAMTESALTTRGYITSFGLGGKKGAANRSPAYGIYDRRLKKLNSTNMATTLGAESDYFTSEMEMIENMLAGFGMGVQAGRKIFRFEKMIWFTVELRIRNVTNNIMETFYKNTVEVKVKSGDVNAAYERAVALAMEGVPNCELVTPESDSIEP